MVNAVSTRCIVFLLAGIWMTCISGNVLSAQDGNFPGIQTPVPDTFYLKVDSNLRIFLQHAGGAQLAQLPAFSGPKPLLPNEQSDPSENASTLNDSGSIQIQPADIVNDKEKFQEGMIPVHYKVRPQETVFRIARIYFKMPILHLMDLNGMDSTNLAIGQVLLVGWLPDNDGTNSTSEADTSMYILKWNGLPENGRNTIPLKHVRETKGVALWDKNMASGSGLIAIHPSARINSLIEIFNPMFNKTVRAKVVGQMPPNRYPKDISIIVSPEVARQLGVLDRRFYVVLRYYE